eukprot:gnl/MRDRNA2_/MRDRNA2_104464_c0_seq1.p1 gnl/MRDRNA2_/MRDRNA2_104464_c0~~gnl/MRDRNA2_/MRDRNA2_104464_c0_seq1.p1  ORF type:complete len:174 (+),score=51.59 gnl/MRDRNA2_/MRDRNA2_104464_c0_seq1:98-619(+)
MALQGAGSLDALIDKSCIECLNQDDAQPVRNILPGEPAEAFLASEEGDPQLLIKLGFTEAVKVVGIQLLVDPDDAESWPQTVKLFSGSASMGFAEAESEAALETWEFPDDKGEPHAMKMGGVKFQNVTTLQIFVESNAGGDATKLRGISFFGQPVNDGSKHWSVTNPNLKYGD